MVAEILLSLKRLDLMRIDYTDVSGLALLLEFADIIHFGAFSRCLNSISQSYLVDVDLASALKFLSIGQLADLVV